MDCNVERLRAVYTTEVKREWHGVIVGNRGNYHIELIKPCKAWRQTEIAKAARACFRMKICGGIVSEFDCETTVPATICGFTDPKPTPYIRIVSSGLAGRDGTPAIAPVGTANV